MLKNEHTVVFWEFGTDKREVIPVCEATPLASSPSTNNRKPSKSTYNCVVLDNHPVPNPRECRKLLKRGFSWRLYKEPAPTEESEIDRLFHYKVIVYDERRLRNRDKSKYMFFFKRLNELEEVAGSCYIADDCCIILLKYNAHTLKICYMDLVGGHTYLHKFVFFNMGFRLKLSNGSLWIVQAPTLCRSEILLVRPNRAYCNCIVMKHFVNVSMRVTLTTLMNEACFSSTCAVFLKLKQYLTVDDTKHCLVERSIELQEFDKFTDFFIIKSLFFATVQNDPPTFCVGVLEPSELRMLRRVDLSKCLQNYKSYVTSFTVSVHHRSMKALLITDESYIIVLDLFTGKVCQLLSYIPCFWTHKLSIHYSVDGKAIKMVGTYQQSAGKTEYLCVNFRAWPGMSLKDVSKQCILSDYPCEYLQQQNLPKNLTKELQMHHVHKDEISKY